MSTHLRLFFTLVAGLAIVAWVALPAEKPFRPKTADRYPTKQRQGDLIVAVKPFISEKIRGSPLARHDRINTGLRRCC